MVEAAIDGDGTNDGAFSVDYFRAGAGCRRWTHRRMACISLWFWSDVSINLEDRSMAGGAGVHDPGVCVDLLLCARLPRTGMDVVDAGRGDWSRAVVAGVARVSRVPA